MTKKEIDIKLKKYCGSLVLDLFKVVKFLGIENDEGDVYYTFQDIEGTVYYTTPDSEFIPLRGNIPAKEYVNLVKIWDLNAKVTDG